MSKWLKLNDCGDRVIRDMALAVVQWVHDVKAARPPYWLSLLGKCGTGKTHCARQVFEWLKGTRRLCWQGWGAVDCPWEYDPYLVHWPTHLQQLRNNKASLRHNDMFRWPFVVLDEVTPDNDRWGPAANALINLLSARTGRWTLLTSNLGIAEMERLDPRISSRLIRDGSNVVIVDTLDYSTRR